MNTQASSPRELCYAVKPLGEGELGSLTPRAWNRFDPSESLWWLVPSKDWPAYKHGKLYFDWDPPEGREALLCGLHVERGLSPSIRAAYPSTKGSHYILESDWTWHRFLEDLGSGSLTSAMHESMQGAALDCFVDIWGGYVPDPGSFDPYNPDFRNNKSKYRFRLREDTDACYPVSLNDPGRYMTQLGKTRSVAGLAQSLLDLEGNPWLWIDVTIGSTLGVGATAEDSLAISDADLWSKHLRHFSPWVR